VSNKNPVVLCPVKGCTFYGAISSLKFHMKRFHPKEELPLFLKVKK
jgi:hypothetical protein